MDTIFFVRVNADRVQVKLGPYIEYYEAVKVLSEYLDGLMKTIYRVDPSEIKSATLEEWCIALDGEMLFVASRLKEIRDAS